MADIKQVLVVDDHFEMLDLLRSMLEVSGHEFQVLAVPSAEEGMLELLRTKFDLLITDVRLPGMSGFDLVRRLRRRYPDLPVIMITAYSSAQGEAEAKELGIYRYFRKPLDTDGMLTAVRTALYGEPVIAAKPAPPVAAADFTTSDVVRKRLDLLRADTGASGLVLATTQGQVLLELGEERRLEIPKLVMTIAHNMRNSFALAEQMGETSHFTLQYHTGQTVELYNASVGRDFFISLFYSVGARRGRIGTIWVFAQRAIKELVELLPPLHGAQPVSKPLAPPREWAAATPVPPTEPQVQPAPGLKPKPQPVQPEPTAAQQSVSLPMPEPLPAADPVEIDMDGLLAALNLDETAVALDVDSYWDEALTTREPDAQTAHTLSFAEAASLVEGLPTLALPAAPQPEEPVMEAADIAGLLDILNLQDQPVHVDLDAFWDVATDEEGIGKGLSFEEARQRGLIAPEMDLSEKE